MYCSFSFILLQGPATEILSWFVDDDELCEENIGTSKVSFETLTLPSPITKEEPVEGQFSDAEEDEE